MYVNNQRSFTCDLCDGTLACALNEICERLIALEREPTEAEIPEFHPGRDCLSVEEAAEAFGARATRTVREWCRHGRIHAHKALSGRGNHQEWRIGREEITRLLDEGLLPPH